MSTKSNTVMKQILNADREIGELLEGNTSFNAIYVKYKYIIMCNMWESNSFNIHPEYNVTSLFNVSYLKELSKRTI